MNLFYSDEQALIQDTARQFSEERLSLNVDALEKYEGREVFLANLKQLAELGYMGLNVNTEFGGTEAGVVAFSLAITELARVCPSTAVTTSVTNMVAECIQAVANDKQKARYLPKICSGEYRAAGFCLTESDAGSDPASMRTRATREGDFYVINGSKLYITSAEYADVFIVWAVTNSDAPKGKGISCFLVEGSTDGLSISKSEEKMGQVGSSTNTVHFDQARIPASALMGIEGQGFKVAVGELAGGRIGIASLALGIGSAAMDIARSYLGEREQFGTKIGNFQGLQWMLADRYTELEAARLLIMQAACKKQESKPFGSSASMAKVFATEKANDACYTALQMMGGAGYTKDFPLERMARDVRITTLYEGTSEIQRVIIARDLLTGYL